MNLFKRHRAPEPEVLPPIEIDRKPSKLRVVLLIVLLVIAVVSLTYGFTELVKVEPGWYILEVTDSYMSCCNDFVCNYYVSDKQMQQDVTAAYTKACKEAYLIFSDAEQTSDMYRINTAVNQEVQIQSTLYQALALMERSGSRLMYMAPVYDEYGPVFEQTDELFAKLYDPAQNPQTMAYIGQLVEFTNAEEHIKLELLGNDRVRLFVSDAYLAFAQEHAIETFVELGWTANAFIIDYLAQVMTDAGYTQGYIVSNDGFTRNLDGSAEYSVNLLDWQDNAWYMPVTMSYTGPMSIVQLRARPVAGYSADALRYFAYADGTVTSTFLDPADGVSKSATDSLVCYSKDATCAQVLMDSAKVFLADALDGESLAAMAGQDIYSIWYEETNLCYNDEAAVLRVDESAMEIYTVTLVK